MPYRLYISDMRPPFHLSAGIPCVSRWAALEDFSELRQRYPLNPLVEDVAEARLLAGLEVTWAHMRLHIKEVATWG